MIDNTLKLVENQVNVHNIHIVKDLNPALPMLPLDENQIQQVLMNMVINAADAMSEGGTLTIKSRFSKGNDFVEITIEDSGCGIPREVIDRIYDPFFTTKEQKKGTGLGLAVSYGIIKKHQGFILVESEVGKGTIFTIRLPLNPIESDEQPSLIENSSEGIVT